MGIKTQKRLYQNKIGKILIFWVLIISSTVSTIVTAITIFQDYKYEVDGFQHSVNLIKSTSSESLTIAIWNLDQVFIETQLNGMLTIPYVKYVELNSKQDNLIFKKGEFPSENYKDYEFVISSQRLL